MSIFTLNGPGTTVNPFVPSNVIIPVSQLQADSVGFWNRFSNTYVTYAHNISYGAHITVTGTLAAKGGGDVMYLGAVVRTGANAGCFMGVAFNMFDQAQVCTVDAAFVRTNISTNGAIGSTDTVGDVYLVDIVITAGTATITASKNGTGITFTLNITTTYATEVTLAGGGAFDGQNSNLTKLSQFTANNYVGGTGAKLLTMINNQAGF